MLINPQQRKKNNLFYNNICIIVCLFCILCFFTSIHLQDAKTAEKTYNLKENSIVGPIKVTNKSQIYSVRAIFNGKNSSSYISGEVLDEQKDTLYEFGADLWHEDGYDSDGYWSEASRDMVAHLTFSEKGTYYLQFNTEDNTMDNITIKISVQKGSYLPHLQIGTICILLMLLIWIILNKTWVKEQLIILNEKFEEMEDD